MKISAIELYQIDLPYAGGVYKLSGGREYRSPLPPGKRPGKALANTIATRLPQRSICTG